jgi:hypothetical protein
MDEREKVGEDKVMPFEDKAMPFEDKAGPANGSLAHGVQRARPSHLGLTGFGVPPPSQLGCGHMPPFLGFTDPVAPAVKPP